MNALTQSLLGACLLFLAASPAVLIAADAGRASFVLGAEQPAELDFVEPECALTLDLDGRQLSANIQIDSLETDARFVFEVNYEWRDPDIRLSMVIEGIRYFPVAPSDLLIMQAEQAEQGRRNLSTAEIDELYDRAAELEDQPDPVFEQMEFTVGGVPVREPWTGQRSPPIAQEQVDLALGPVQTIPDGQPDSVIPISFSYSGPCAVVRQT